MPAIGASLISPGDETDAGALRGVRARDPTAAWAGLYAVNAA